MEGEEREALAMPVREEVDELSAFQQLAEAPADDLGDAGAGKAFLEFGQTSGRWSATPRLRPWQHAMLGVSARRLWVR